jgi:hypothetical protein
MCDMALDMLAAKVELREQAIVSAAEHPDVVRPSISARGPWPLVVQLQKGGCLAAPTRRVGVRASSAIASKHFSPRRIRYVTASLLPHPSAPPPSKLAVSNRFMP